MAFKRAYLRTTTTKSKDLLAAVASRTKRTNSHTAHISLVPLVHLVFQRKRKNQGNQANQTSARNISAGSPGVGCCGLHLAPGRDAVILLRLW